MDLKHKKIALTSHNITIYTEQTRVVFAAIVFRVCSEHKARFLKIHSIKTYQLIITIQLYSRMLLRKKFTEIILIHREDSYTMKYLVLKKKFFILGF